MERKIAKNGRSTRNKGDNQRASTRTHGSCVRAIWRFYSDACAYLTRTRETRR
ncbi:uncharacterized protein DS421_11g326240 [Arachis hypogaea]|nr:uncharacterized protein DS421_11g326240 [Arachis hypogaea]